MRLRQRLVCVVYLRALVGWAACMALLAVHLAAMVLLVAFRQPALDKYIAYTFLVRAPTMLTVTVSRKRTCLQLI